MRGASDTGEREMAALNQHIDQVASVLEAIPSTRVDRGVSLNRRTTYRIGGPAALIAQVGSAEAASEAVRALVRAGEGYFVLGGGSNVLASDSGFGGVLLGLGRGLGAVEVRGTSLVAGGAAPLARVAGVARDSGLSGLEFCAGIPGTFGGALRMDAGSRTDWIGPLVRSVEVVTPAGELVRLDGGEVSWGYRTTSFPEGCLIVGAELRLSESSRDSVAAAMRARMERRRATQPLDKPSCGSFFRNPATGNVGQLIEECGLKGYAVGGAEVSRVHANFIVNAREATSADVLAVARHVHGTVLRMRGVDLVREVRLLGPEGLVDQGEGSSDEGLG